MLLSSAYLFKQWQFQNIESGRSDSTARLPYSPTSPESTLELKLLKVYLETRATYGVFEVLSHVYLPHSLTALFNLYDFAEDITIRSNALVVINRIVHQILTCTTDSGVATLSASCRAFLRTRLRSHSHNINQLIRLLVGVSPDEFGPNALTDFLLTTSWRPNNSVTDSHLMEGFLRKTMNPHLKEMPTIFLSDRWGLSDEDMTPFFWSAGLVNISEILCMKSAHQM
jgi:hypothetical protein